MNSGKLLRCAASGLKFSRILGVFSKIICALSFVSLAGALVIFVKDLAQLKTKG
ncbi:MAG: hypothetical protein FWG82_04390 [Oscillospiraceae bacterium]|nr:hypothetical protein [Oscillospiraceae bacterium]